MAWQVIIGRVALRDLERIRDFIARDNPAAAVSFCQKLLDRAEALREFPERGGHLKERPRCTFLGCRLLSDHLSRGSGSGDSRDPPLLAWRAGAPPIAEQRRVLGDVGEAFTSSFWNFILHPSSFLISRSPLARRSLGEGGRPLTSVLCLSACQRFSFALS